jgi:hypothetical protein
MVRNGNLGFLPFGEDCFVYYLCPGFSFIGLGLISFIGLVKKRTGVDPPFFF